MKSETKSNLVDSQKTAEKWYTIEELAELTGYSVESLKKGDSPLARLTIDFNVDTRLGGYHNTQKFYSANVLKALKEYQIKTSVPNALKDKQTALEGNLSYIGNVAVNGVAGELDIMQCIENALVLVRGEVAKLKQQNSQLQEENGSLQIQFDENKKWRTIKWMESKTQQHFNWRELKKASLDLGYDVKKVFDQNYGEVNTYHIDAWERAYGDAVASVILDDVEE